ncbi:DUF4129 domain-containing transglutaminase family protein [Paenibacillus tepidiphilus]|uniref:DUF4129 domain-containing transglutaminase family protein n=1 Tax=Paenibacillus tepidiphilus TaxID=2608683 RepID=UPI0013A5AF38|nr:transglutaminase domain-containing protein [Paenibacillus tepidiphilus]
MGILGKRYSVIRFAPDGGSPAAASRHPGGSSAPSACGVEYSLPENPEWMENSKADNRGNAPFYYRLLFSLTIAGVFMEWLLPLHRRAQGGPTAELLEILMLAAAALLFWGSFRLPVAVQAGGQFAIMALTWYCAAAAGAGPGWLEGYAAGFREEAALLFSGRVAEISEATRLLILAGGWGLLVCSVQQLALHRGSAALFYAVTILYLLALNLVFGLETDRDVLIAAGLILWMLSLGALLRLAEAAGRRRLPYIRWGGCALAAAVLLALAAWAGGQLYGPRPASQLTLQQVYAQLQDFAGGQLRHQPGTRQAKTTGYGPGDQELGAPLTPSAEPVFTVSSGRPVYLKGESLADYDGRRWLKDGDPLSRLSLTALPAGALPEAGATLEQHIRFVSPSPGGVPLFQAGAVLDVGQIALTDGSRLGFVLNGREHGGFWLPLVGRAEGIREYTVTSRLPESDPEVLRTLQGGDPYEVARDYLQLPASLPARVAQLSGELTAGAASRYDAAAAVRDYLQQNYMYTLDTRIPPAGADFADDFLFGTRQGYCVHFATAMTVLLRSSGIPARYIQGYGPGTPLAGAAAGSYSITGADAHAWVEVYFPGAGWVPFDPTPGFSAAAAQAADPAAEHAAAPEPSAAHRADALPPALPPAGGPGAPLAAAALLLAAAAWRWRRSLALLPALLRPGSVSRERQLRAAALAWRGLAARFGPPPPGVTAREYAAALAVDDPRLRRAAGEFVRQWETLAYGAAGPPCGCGPPARADGAAFVARCLAITFRLG